MDNEKLIKVGLIAGVAGVVIWWLNAKGQTVRGFNDGGGQPLTVSYAPWPGPAGLLPGSPVSYMAKSPNDPVFGGWTQPARTSLFTNSPKSYVKNNKRTTVYRGSPSDGYLQDAPVGLTEY